MGELLTAASGAWTGISGAIDIAKALLATKIDTEVKLQVSEMVDRLGEAQGRLFQLREELIRLQGENGDLRQKIASLERWEQRQAEYKLVRTAGGATVYESMSEPRHFACPSCMEGKTVQILQDMRLSNGRFKCPKCEADYPVNPRRPPPPRRQSSGFGA